VLKFIGGIKVKTIRGGNKTSSLNQQETKKSNKNGSQISEFYYKTSWFKNSLDSIVIAHDYSCISRRCIKFWAYTANHNLGIVTTNGNTERGDLKIYSYGTILVFFCKICENSRTSDGIRTRYPPYGCIYLLLPRIRQELIKCGWFGFGYASFRPRLQSVHRRHQHLVHPVMFT